jgi:hypothetical protein
LNNSGKAFQPQRNLMQYAKGGDGGISIAADAGGAVYAVWHAMGAEPGEDHRRVYLARSTDDGKTCARSTDFAARPWCVRMLRYPRFGNPYLIWLRQSCP